MPAAVKVRIYSPIGTTMRMADLTLDPQLTRISWSYALPGGPNTLEVGIEEPEQRAGWGATLAFIPHAVQVVPFSHVEVVVNGVMCWAGRAVEGALGPLGVQGFVAEGYGISASNDDFYESSSTTETTTGDIISDIVSATSNLIYLGGPDEFADPLVTHMRAEFTGMTLAMALDQVLSEGGNGFVNWDWWVTVPGRRLVLQPRTAPSTPDYRIGYDPVTTEIRLNYRNLYGSAKVFYQAQTVEFETATASDPNFNPRWGLNRRLRIQADELSATAAEQLRDMEIERRQEPELSIALTLGPENGLHLPGGAPLPNWLLQTGRWVQVADLDAQIITNINYDAKTDQASIDLGRASWVSFDSYLAATCDEVTKLAVGINPKTGGRQRGVRQQTAIAALTSSAVGAVVDGNLDDIGTPPGGGVINNNFAELNAKIDALRAVFIASQMTAGS